MTALSRFAMSVSALVVLSGCASTTVTARHPYTGEKLARPDHIIIYDFGASPGDVPSGSALTGRVAQHGAPQTDDQIALGRKLGAEVAEQLAEEIRAMGLPAARAAGGPAPRVGDIVIRGYFVSIQEGSAGNRVLVGFGEGAADLQAAVEGYQVTPRGLRLLGSGQTEATGSKTPGMLVGVATLAATGNPVGLIVGGASKLMGEEKGSETIEGEAKRVAQEIAKELKVKFKQQGWI